MTEKKSNTTQSEKPKKAESSGKSAEAEGKKESGKTKLSYDKIEKLIVELAKEGKTPAQIGLILRDKHAVPTLKIFGKKVEQVLKEKGVEYIDEKKLVEEKIARLRAHVERNRHDYKASRALTKQLWALHRITKRAK